MPVGEELPRDSSRDKSCFFRSLKYFLFVLEERANADEIDGV